MKIRKFIFFFALLFLFLGNIKAMEPSVEYLDGYYSNRIGNDKVYSGKLGFIVVDNKVIFCLDPYTIIGKNYESNNNYFNNFSNADLTYIKLISNYVNVNVQNRNVQYYMAAQELIWERIIGEGKIFWTNEINGGGMRYDIEIFKNEIKSNVDNFLTKPSFDGTTIKDNYYKIIELEDENNVLENYEIINNSKNVIWKENNKLYIKILSENFENIKLIRKVGTGNPVYYHSEANQDLANLNSEVSITSEINIQANNIFNQNLTLNFLDKNNLNIINDKINFKIKNLDTNEYIINTTTFNGTFLSNLNKGKYLLEIENAPYNYLITSVEFSVDVNDVYNENRVINIYLDKPIGVLNLNIYKEGIYQLYKQSELGGFDKFIETFIHSSSIELPLGKYYLIDIKDNKLYDLSFSYKDDRTPIIYLNFDLYPDKINNKEEVIIDDLKKEDDIIPDNVCEKETINFKDELPNTSDYITSLKKFLLFIFGVLCVKKSISK